MTVTNMDFDTLKQTSKVKVLLRGESGYGKTKTSAEIALLCLDAGLDVLYADTESEGSGTLVNLIERGDWDEDVVENLTYRQVDDYGDLEDVLEQQERFDLVVIDTLDHKHSYALKGVTDAKRSSDADWNQYPQIYSAEKQIMEKIGKPDANIIATLDPSSGKMDKPKGAQTNIHGYFSIVIDLKKSGNEWINTITNWIGRSEVIGKGTDNLAEGISSEIIERSQLEP